METKITLRPQAPFRLDFTVYALRRLPKNMMDRWDGETYSRILIVEGCAIEIRVKQKKSSDKTDLDLLLRGKKRITPESRLFLISTIKKILGLDVDLSDFYQLANKDERLSKLVQRFMGLRPPRLPSLFETALNGFACQQLSLNVGIQLLNRLTSAYGLAFEGQHGFPRPDDLVHAKLQDLKDLGFSSHKAEFILKLSQAIVGHEIHLESLAQLNNEAALSRLLEIHGVGGWTAEYILLRGLGRLDIIPTADVGIQNKLHKWFNLKKRPNPAEVKRLLSRWTPYNGMIYFYLLLDYLSSKGTLEAKEEGKQRNQG